MFRLYLFFSDMRELYQSMSDEETADCTDMARKMLKGYSREQILQLRDSCLRVAAFLEGLVK